MRLIFLSVMLVSAFGASLLAARGEPANGAPTGLAPCPAGAKAINAICPVDRDNPVDPATTIVYRGKVIGFCCQDCVREFQKDPDRYLADLNLH